MRAHMQDLQPIKATRKSGREAFHLSGDSFDFDLLDFWSWSTSDLVSNATRGRLGVCCRYEIPDSRASGEADTAA